MKEFKHYLAFSLCLFFVMLLATGCGKKEIDPTISQSGIKAVGNLATMECYYNNVAVLEKESGKGFWHLGEKDRKAWAEYTGLVKIGIDMTKVDIKQNGTDITITIPAAEVLSISTVNNTLTEDSFIISDDSIFNKNPITYEDQSGMITKAQETMEEKAKSDEGILTKAQERAKLLIANYVNGIGEKKGVNYNITWKEAN
ncbi:MAG: DUF4230 domain-containing protein [Lachnospiraceae bacterium]|nr:DUF4230 domain-containing protein [Lachnospiraceae bacterium]